MSSKTDLRKKTAKIYSILIYNLLFRKNVYNNRESGSSANVVGKEYIAGKVHQFWI